MEFGEGTAKIEFKKIDSSDTRERIKVRIEVFFDGTLNNAVNINQRLLASDESNLTQEEQYASEDLKRSAGQKEIDEAKKVYQKFGKPGSDNSYEGYYTNVYKLFQYSNIKKGATQGFDAVTKVYIEGAGTIDKKKDDKVGSGFAMGAAGVPKKVKIGISKTIDKITAIAPDTSKIIELLTIDVYGFSRGAASARKFIHDALFGRRFVLAGGSLGGPDPETTLRSQLTKMGYSIQAPGAEAGVKVCLAGLFDTVSTYGVGVVVDEDDNVDALNLNAVFHAEETFHLTSSDEHRYHFSLTNTQSAGGRGKQYFLPGVHSDIGGGYREDGSENQDILGSTGFVDSFLLQSCDVSPEEAKADMEYLIDSGWFRQDEVQTQKVNGSAEEKNMIKINIHTNYIETPGMMKSNVPPQKIERAITSTKRFNLHNNYSVIPLKIMAEAARKNKIVFITKLDDDETVPSELNDVNGKIQAYINMQSNYSSKNTDWLDNRETWMKKMRHDYFHFSARMELGHDPRIVDGKRVRKIYRG